MYIDGNDWKMPLAGVGVAIHELEQVLVGAGVLADRDAEILDGRPQRVVHLVPVRREVDVGRVERELHGARALVGDALHLLQRALDVVQREDVHRDES